MPLKLYNTLTRQVEEFRPADPSRVTFYSCGPTVYDDAHIGNFRSFLAADVLRRWIESPLCEIGTEARRHEGTEERARTVVHVMNITDVGHMTDDAEGGESGEDRMAVAGKRLLEQKKAGKLPADAKLDPNNPYDIARFYEMRFREDAKKLGLKLATEAEKNPGLMPRATENVERMRRMIRRLIERGHAYAAGSPGAGRVVYFRVKSFDLYGRLSGNTLEKLRAGEGGRVSEGNQSQKEHPADFLLWKEDPSHIMKWDSPVDGWGQGYPGWHIECSVMSVVNLLGADRFESMLASDGVTEPIIDLHSGGEDNIFPHHECEIAQTCGCFMSGSALKDPARATYAKMWFHPRFLLVEGTKMSKSKGNFFTARDLFAKGIEPAALRLELIKTHYRSNANFTMQGLTDSQSRLERWRRYARRVLRRSATAIGGGPTSSMTEFETFEREIIEALSDDLNMARAIAALDTRCNEFPDEAFSDAEMMAREKGYPIPDLPALPATPMSTAEASAMLARGKDAKTYEWELGLLFLLDSVLGVIFQAERETTQTTLGVFMDGITADPAVIAKLEDRRAARAAKDFKRSDAIRDEIAAMGYAIKDVTGGKVEVRRA